MCVWSQTLHHFYFFCFELTAGSWLLPKSYLLTKAQTRGCEWGVSDCFSIINSSEWPCKPQVSNNLASICGDDEFRAWGCRSHSDLVRGNPLRFYALVLFSLWRFDTSLSDQFPLEIHTFKMVLKKKSWTSDISNVNQTSCWRTTNNTVVVSWWKRCGFVSRQNDFGKSCASCLQSTLLVLPCTNRKPWVHTFPSPAFYGEIQVLLNSRDGG